MNFIVSSDTDSVAWKLRAGQQLRAVEGDGESVIYNDCSGETHLLSAIAVDLLQQLEKGPATLSCISTFLQNAWEFESGDELRQTVQRLLTDLDESSLIEACRS